MWLAAAAAVVVAATAPFLLPYLAVRQHGFRPRPLEEVRRYSADVYSYLRGLDDSIWRGWLTDFTREEGTLFPGLVPVVLAAVGIAAVAVWLSFGPVVETKGFRLTDQSVYVWL